MVRKSVRVHGLLAVAVLLIGGTALTQPKNQPAQKPGARSSPQAVNPNLPANLDVEEVQDNPQKYAGRVVSVAGEVESWVAPRSFVLESGGLFDDEMTVIVPANAKGLSPESLVDEADIVVTGRVITATVVDVEQDYGLDVWPEYETEYVGTRVFMIADRLDYQRR